MLVTVLTQEQTPLDTRALTPITSLVLLQPSRSRVIPELATLATRRLAKNPRTPGTHLQPEVP